MSTLPFAALGVGLLVLLAAAPRLPRLFLTLPGAAILLGLLAGRTFFMPEAGEHALEVLAEAALAVLLFADGAHSQRVLGRAEGRTALRLLALGMPLALLIGTALFVPFLSGWPILEVALLAALLVPTDAALGREVAEGEVLSPRSRAALTAESGLNDGLALPAIIFIACAAVGFQHALQEENWLLEAGRQLLLGGAAGAGLGLIGGRLARACRGRPEAVPPGVLPLVLVGVIFAAAAAAEANAFVAVFAGGRCYAAMHRDERAPVTGAAGLETAGALLSLVAFVYVGAVLLPPALAQATVAHWTVSILALAAMRPLAIGLSLIGSDVTLRERLLLGWFGPRGLATALFCVFALSRFDDLARAEPILTIAALTTALSALVHGATAILADRAREAGKAQLTGRPAMGSAG